MSGLVKAAVNTYSHSSLGPASASDWAWNAANLSIWKTTPTFALLGGATGAGAAKFEEVKGDTANPDLRAGVQAGALIGGGLGAAMGLPGVVKYGLTAAKHMKGAQVGLQGNTIHSAGGLGDAWL